MAKETRENYHCYNETNEAKLRGAMGPMYNLPSTVLMFDETKDVDKKDILYKILINQAKRANKTLLEIKELLITIESENYKRVITAQIDILKEHVEHPNKPGHKRHDILEKIKKLELV